MITAIDFGCHTIRSAFRSPEDRKQISLFSERAEYAVIPDTKSHVQALADNRISYAECEDSLVVYGNRARSVRWLSRKPSAPLFTDGAIPKADAPARQILNLITRGVLPVAKSHNDVCLFTGPAGKGERDNDEFLSRIIKMHGWTPIKGSAANAVILSAGQDTRFTGISIVFGSETTRISIARFGQEIVSDCFDVGSNWIDSELASQFKLHTWDENGDSYLDFEGVRKWKRSSELHLRNSVDEREKTLARLYGVLLNRVAKVVRDQMNGHAVKSVLGNERLGVVCAGGATLIGGFAGALTERFVEHDIASELLSVSIAEDPETAVVRGLLIQGELEALNESRTAA